MNKYYNKKVKIGEETFDSKLEYQRYLELQNLALNGKIFDLRRQVKFVLIPTQTKRVGNKDKVVERECTYIADFVYTDEAGNVVVEDTKSPYLRKRDSTYKIKRKLMLWVHGIQIKELS